MSCRMCDAPIIRALSHCPVCGHAYQAHAAKRWDRTVEADLFEDLQKAIPSEEPLLAATRGKVVGGWRGGFSLNPKAFFSPYVNLGLSDQRLLLQRIHPSTGRAFSETPSASPLTEVRSLSCADADAIEPGRTVRLTVEWVSGELLRLRAVGRFAQGAREMEEVWKSLVGNMAPKEAPWRFTCPHCHRSMEQAYRFCPFCGKHTGDSG
jgi:RNA polymerase subunit RPABC4/transcription elongation factor Spt4